MDQKTVEKALQWNSLTNLGKTAKLKWSVDPSHTQWVLDNKFADHWIPYNQKKDQVNNRWGLPVTSYTGEIDDNYHLNSFSYMKKVHGVELKEENCTTPTPVYDELPEIAGIMDKFRPDIGRVHFLRVDQGGFWPPHRDFHTIAPDWLRLTTVFGKCKPENSVLLIDGEPTYFDPGYFYFVNFQLDHSVFSFSNSLYLLVLTVANTEQNVNTILGNTMAE